MKDLSVLVIDQVCKILMASSRFFISVFETGNYHDRIDYNIQNVAASVEEG
jgi:hypothetical protein